MKTELKKIENRDILYGYMAEMPFPYNYKADRSVWTRSFLSDTDGEGRTLFSGLTTLGAYSGEKLIGFVQYGKSAFGFDESGEISGAVSYPVIRSLYYDKDCSEAGKDLLNAAVSALSEDNAGRICGKGIGSRCMDTLKAYLHSNGIARFDTDTALSNMVAQHYYEKNGFVNEGLTRSYYRDI